MAGPLLGGERVELVLERALAHHRALLESAQARLASRTRPQSPGAFALALRERLGKGGSSAPGPRRAGGEGSRRPRAAAPAPRRYVVRPGDSLWALAVHRFHVDVAQLARANGLRDPERIRPGQVLRIPNPAAPRSPQRVVASWYGPGFDGRPMANGEPYDRNAATVAHRTLPFGTRLLLRNPRTGAVAVARVADRGPFVAGRDLDLSWGLARELGVLEAGVAPLEMTVLE